MSEPICEICGRTIGLGEGCCAHGTPHVYEWEEECYRLGYEREKARAEEKEQALDGASQRVARYADRLTAAEARADRYEADPRFSACKALLIAAEGRAEEAERRLADRGAGLDALTEKMARVKEMAESLAAAEQRASEARAALERCIGALDVALDGLCREEKRYREWVAIITNARAAAYAALPVEPARRQVTENANALGAPAARSPATPEEES
jgi:chromosome segregation ATPase